MRAVKRAAAFALAASMLAVSASCKRCGETTASGEAPAATVVDEPTVPAPPRLLGEVVIATPNASWAKLQKGIAGALGILPSTAGGVVCTAAGLDPFLASEIDGATPAFAVLSTDAQGDVRYVLALKLLDVRKARARLLESETARFTAKELSSATELVANGGGGGTFALSLGISKNGYFLLARASEDLEALGPYATRTLPKKKVSDGAIVLDVPHDALSSIVRPKLEALWTSAKGFLVAEDERMRKAHGGRAPDFADAKGIVDVIDGFVRERIVVIGDLDGVHAAFDVLDDALSLDVAMPPAPGSGPAAKSAEAMEIGSTAPLEALPKASAVAFMARDDEAARVAQASEITRATALALGARLGPTETKKLEGALEEWTKARSDVTTAALVIGARSSPLVRLGLRDEEAASRAARATLDVARSAPFKAMLRARDITTDDEDVAGLGHVTVVTMTREPEPRGPKSVVGKHARERSDDGPSRFAWRVGQKNFEVAFGPRPAEALAGAAQPTRKLGDDPAVVGMLGALGPTVSRALVLQPLLLDAPVAPSAATDVAAPVVVAWGRREKTPYLHAEAKNVVVRALVRRETGL